jgi:hypothetical protein
MPRKEGSALSLIRMLLPQASRRRNRKICAECAIDKNPAKQLSGHTAVSFRQVQLSLVIEDDDCRYLAELLGGICWETWRFVRRILIVGSITASSASMESSDQTAQDLTDRDVSVQLVARIHHSRVSPERSRTKGGLGQKAAASIHHLGRLSQRPLTTLYGQLR